MKPNENARGKSRADHPTTPHGELHKVEAIWRAIVDQLNTFDVDENRQNDETT
jgi:hypothetical protein